MESLLTSCFAFVTRAALPPQNTLLYIYRSLRFECNNRGNVSTWINHRVIIKQLHYDKFTVEYSYLRRKLKIIDVYAKGFYDCIEYHKSFSLSLSLTHQIMLENLLLNGGNHYLDMVYSIIGPWGLISCPLKSWIL